jgi:hypothetical protein
MHDELEDDEAWCDDDQLDDEVAAECPECGAEVPSFIDRCPACGYWLSDADRRAATPGLRKQLWLKVTAVVVILALLGCLLGFAPLF